MSFLLSNIAFADEYSDFMRTLKLSEKQQTTINQIEQKYSREIVKLRADVILRNMNIAKTGVNTQNMLNSDFVAIQNELDELLKEKQDEIASNLGMIQRFKYRKYCQRGIM